MLHNNALNMFQFLMVQLKDPTEYKHSITSVVSIPYGTIKSKTLANNRKGGRFVSIPYGTIKRNLALNQFQEC